MRETIAFGEWLRKQRRSLDLTRQALADQAGCAEITLRRIENGTLKPSKELALVLLEKLGIPEFERSKWILFARGHAGFPISPIDSSIHQPLSNLPASLTTFIGREKEQAEIIKHIRKYRLVSLIGPGGVGKTRLSIKVGEQVLGEYANGVWLVELASLNDPALLPQTVMALFGIAAQSNIPHTEILINFLRTKTILLILDNCEHLLEACAQLADTLLKNCPNLKILATSRESLGITGEATYPIPSLGLPDLEQLLENFREYESVRLFEERAQLAKTDFSLTLENASFVAQICHRLDGIPLAIELAAAHVNMFSTEQIAARLNESFNLLTGGSRTALPRQQTIRASIEWSWNLLSDSERILLQRLSVFAGGWILESAESVCSGSGIESHQVLELMSQLVSKSLIVVNQESGSERHYHLLETIRQYAHEKLGKAGEQENIRTQHLKYFLELSEQAEPELHGPQQMEWLKRTNDERDNLRAALGWAARTDLEAGLYLSSRLGRFWESFDIREGTYWLAELLEKPESNAYPIARAKALCAHGNFLHLMRSYDRAHAQAEECLALYRAHGNQQGEVDSLLLAGAIPYEGPNSEINHNQKALALAQALGDGWRQARALWRLGWSTGREHRLAYWEQAIALYRQAGDWRVLADILGAFGFYLVLAGEVESAQKHLDESNILFRQLNIRSGGSYLPSANYRIAMMRGDYQQARVYLQEDMTAGEELGVPMWNQWARVRLGHVALREGNLAEARDHLSKAASEFQKAKIGIGVAFTLEGIASLNILIDKPERAALLLGWTTAIRDQIGEPRWQLEQADADRDIAAIIAKIGNTKYKEAYDNGRVLTLDEAITYALGES